MSSYRLWRSLNHSRLDALSSAWRLRACTATRVREYFAALKADRQGWRCGICHGVNLFCDDCGFFYVNDQKDDKASVPICSACWRGPVGQAHTARYGCGER